MAGRKRKKSRVELPASRKTLEKQLAEALALNEELTNRIKKGEETIKSLREKARKEDDMNTTLLASQSAKIKGLQLDLGSKDAEIESLRAELSHSKEELSKIIQADLEKPNVNIPKDTGTAPATDESELGKLDAAQAIYILRKRGMI